ncbi:hypothetical protein [Pseudooceanicola algae]|uniref:Uncharacterized protein n=1 Tax=Pseudooceanicola algae TaxID=1537215 RepID=A0A418SKC3_9RHOB|nr:hypothetical protein [Pseudooceanicola algae]QPM89148.1 hypothetical protein PSAL_003590 [Pseudooceanicola algae]
MCKAPSVDTRPAIISAGTGQDSTQSADLEARLRRARSGAAANILTSPLGIPARSKLGAPQ